MPVVFDDEKPDTSLSGGMFDRALASKRPTAVLDPPKTWGETLSPENISSTLGASTTGVVEGIPIVGPLLRRGVAGAAALPAAAVPGMTVGGAYRDIMQQGEREKAEHPTAATVGNVTGGVMSTVPVARALPKLFGGSSFAGQTAAGGTIGGVDAAIRSGGDPTSTAVGAGLGAAGPTIGSILAPVGQLAGAGVRWAAERTPGVKSVLAPKIVPPPNKEIFDAATGGFDTLSRGGVKYSPQHLDDVNTLIKGDLYSMSKGTARSAAETHAVMDDLKNLPPNPSSLHRTRLDLQEIINKHPAGSAEAQSAMHAKKIIENFMEAPPANAVISGQFDAATVGARLKEANANYRAAMTDQALRDRVAKGLVDSENQAIPYLAEGQRTRQAVGSLRKDPNEAKFRLPNEEAALRDISRSGSIGESALRGMSHVTGSGRFGTPLTTAAAMFGAGSAVFPPAAVLGAGIAGGLGSSAATTALTRRAVENASNTIRANAPYSQAQMRPQVYQSPIPGAPYTPWKPSIGARDYRNEISRLLALQAERTATEP
jgi:hypothetical protein